MTDIDAPELLRARQLLRDINWYGGRYLGETLKAERSVADELLAFARDKDRALITERAAHEETKCALAAALGRTQQ
jgi:hypothetical protein